MAGEEWHIVLKTYRSPGEVQMVPPLEEPTAIASDLMLSPGAPVPCSPCGWEPRWLRTCMGYLQEDAGVKRNSARDLQGFCHLIREKKAKSLRGMVKEQI